MENNKRKPEKTRFRTKIDWIAGTFLLGLSIYAIIHSYLALPLGTHSNPGPGYMPMLLGIVLGLFALIILATGHRSSNFGDLDWPGFTHAVGIVTCCIFAIFAMERLGYRITILLILLFFFGFLERLNLWVVLVLSAALTFGSYALFHNLLNVPLPLGGFGF